jgi:hypothetical protein
MNSFNTAYADETFLEPIEPGAINNAYVLTWLILWFRTSDYVHQILHPRDMTAMTPPANCPQPSWVGDLSADIPMPEIAEHIDIDRIHESILCLILAVFLLGAFFISSIIHHSQGSPDDEDWVTFRCDLYWLRIHLYHLFDFFHHLLLQLGLVYPYPGEFDYSSEIFNFADYGVELPDYISEEDLTIPYNRGRDLIRSRSIPNGFPLRLLDPGEVGIIQRFFLSELLQSPWWIFDPEWPGYEDCPLYGEELPQMTAFTAPGKFPDYIIDSSENPLTPHNDVKTPPASGLIKVTSPLAGVPVVPSGFGNILANTEDLFQHLFRHPDMVFPDWNLEADRCIGHLTWKFASRRYNPDDAAVVPEE